jgi:flagellar basal-body rod modification protein FlgD
MTVDTVTTVPRTTLQSSNATNKGVASDLQTFLRMLTAQLQNQDPLNPLESTDFAVQLATFSGVEQQVQTNQLLANLSSSFGISDLSKAAGLIGDEVRSTAPPQFNGAPVNLYFDVPKSAYGAEMVVRNAAGFEISRQAIAPGTKDGVWSGLAEGGDPLPAGTYSFAVEVPKPDGTVDTLPVHSYSRVAEAEAVDGRVQLILANGGRVGFDEITGVRGG